MRPEKKFWKEIKSKTSNVNWTRIESWASPGVPDLFGVFKKKTSKTGFQFWIELKCNKLQKVIISPKQIAWHYAHTKHGGISFVLVKISAEGGRDGRIAVFPGKLVRELSVQGLKLLDQGSGVLLPHPWTEEDLQNTLIGSHSSKAK
tara:strand:- start:437 stop:877 length:441 start_codon:yes stop_codon:yes gene_type:complete